MTSRCSSTSRQSAKRGFWRCVDRFTDPSLHSDTFGPNAQGPLHGPKACPADVCRIVERRRYRAMKNIVLVHGGFVDGAGWEGVYKILKRDGYSVSIVQNECGSVPKGCWYRAENRSR